MINPSALFYRLFSQQTSVVAAAGSHDERQRMIVLSARTSPSPLRSRRSCALIVTLVFIETLAGCPLVRSAMPTSPLQLQLPPSIHVSIGPSHTHRVHTRIFDDLHTHLQRVFSACFSCQRQDRCHNRSNYIHGSQHAVCAQQNMILRTRCDGSAAATISCSVCSRCSDRHWCRGSCVISACSRQVRLCARPVSVSMAASDQAASRRRPACKRE